jgi:hypothetical protein
MIRRLPRGPQGQPLPTTSRVSGLGNEPLARLRYIDIALMSWK